MTAQKIIVDYFVMNYQKHISKRQVWGYEILGVWLFLVLGMTVFGRESKVYSEINLSIVGTIIERLQFNIDTRLEVIFNVFMLFPIGIAQNLINENSIHSCGFLAMGCIISGIIEVCQLVFHKGTFELVDILENSIGYVLGLLIAVYTEKKINKVRNK